MADKVTTPVSPKVSAGAAVSLIVGLALAALTGIVNGLDPNALAFLGPWSGVAYSAIITGAGALTAYLKRDPLRDAGAEITGTPIADIDYKPMLPSEAYTPVANDAAPVEESTQSTTFGDAPTDPPATQ